MVKTQGGKVKNMTFEIQAEMNPWEYDVSADSPLRRASSQTVRGHMMPNKDSMTTKKIIEK